MAAKGYIDTHIHIWPEVGEKSKPSRYTVEDHFAQSRPAGVERTVLIQQSAMYRYDNTYMLEALRAHPKAFSAVALIDVDQPAAAVEKTVADLYRQGVRGFRITANPKLPWPETPGMQALWKASGERKMVVCPLIDPAAFGWVATMCERNPKVIVAIDHLARIGATGKVEDADVRALCGLARFPRMNVKISAFYALGKKTPPYDDLAPMIRQVFETYGPRRLMWGSDAPYQVLPPHSYQASVDLIETRLKFLGKEDREWILRRTAEGLFFAK